MRDSRSILLLVVAAAVSTSTSAAQELRTPSEQSGFEQYTSYNDMMTYLQAVQGTSTEMKLGIYGTSWEGRALPYAVFSRPAVSQPWEAAALGRPVIVLNANVHGGERTLRESLLILIRELARSGSETNALLDHLVIVVAPQINPDGFEATERGTRGNAWGIDMNRDWVKLEQPALTNYSRNVIQTWNPHLFVDGHNGGSFPYNLNYQCPSHAEPDQRITLLCDEEIFPAIDARLEAEGYKSWFYQRGTETAWFGGGSDARIGRNYGGFRNAVAILFESPGSQPLSDGVAAGILAFKAVLEYARDHSDKLIETVNRARRETIMMGRAPQGDVVVQMEYAPEEYTVTYEIGVGDGENREVSTVQSDSLMKRPVPTLVRQRPYAYLFPRDAIDAAAMLRRHNITVDVLQEPLTVNVQAYTVAGIEHEQAYNHAAATRVRVGEVVTVQRTFPRGTYVVQTGQMLGRLVAHMLEAETNDNVIYWNTMDAWLPRPGMRATGQGSSNQEPALVPIFKLMSATAMSTRMMP